MTVREPVLRTSGRILGLLVRERERERERVREREKEREREKQLKTRQLCAGH